MKPSASIKIYVSINREFRYYSIIEDIRFYRRLNQTDSPVFLVLLRTDFWSFFLLPALANLKVQNIFDSNQFNIYDSLSIQAFF